MQFVMVKIPIFLRQKIGNSYVQDVEVFFSIRDNGQCSKFVSRFFTPELRRVLSC